MDERNAHILAWLSWAKPIAMVDTSPDAITVDPNIWRRNAREKITPIAEVAGIVGHIDVLQRLVGGSAGFRGVSGEHPGLQS